jgi:membrane protein DedA with SNARE-associated domain
VLWVSTFLGLGYFLGERWESVEKNIHHYAVIATVIGVTLAAAWLALRWWKKKRQ